MVAVFDCRNPDARVGKAGESRGSLAPENLRNTAFCVGWRSAHGSHRTGATSPINGRLHPPPGGVATDQTRNLRPAQSRHLLDVAPHQATRRFALDTVLLSYQ